jgi:hypothetical protein
VVLGASAARSGGAAFTGFAIVVLLLQELEYQPGWHAVVLCDVVDASLTANPMSTVENELWFVVLAP